ncbi:alpha-L-fucosidase [Pedobacter frigiditerrae]|uniref:alpha-L-fucosidase n=1 Tax=Pedobacter frigiditerrae TaxID=2530452 RepID=UPI0029303902|nr:alpha-L-fucosidase [Pedobacter frigiditerrae]
MKKIVVVFCLVFISFFAVSQTYKAPADGKVAAKLSQWGEKKFGLFMHWGIYAIPGIVESWSINSEDASWIPRDSTKNYEEYKKWYFDISKQFNPVKFDPTIWASYAKKAGMQYVVFTTKHHDGFAMFDTKQSTYKITGSDVPFATNSKANIAKEVFSAFRKEGFMIGAYFSKPDWHNENYWWPRYATPDRNNNYDIRLHPQRWDNFKKFTYNQIEELMSDYGSVDILWLDGGWVRPKATVNEEVLSWGAPIPAWDQDINMPNIAKMAREKQPGLIIVDRTVHGEYENYQTPEQKIPEKPLNYPWETCMTMGDAWGYVPNDNYKSTNTLIHLLVDVVAKGGNFLLDVGPKPDGTFPEPVLQRLTEIGNWMDINKEAIYATRPIAPFKTENVCFTESKTGILYALYLIDEKSVAPLKIRIKSPPKMPKKVTLFGLKSTLKWKQIGDDLEIVLPIGAKDLKHALVFKME